MDQHEIVDLPAQPYAAVVGHVTMSTVPAIADRFGEVLGWLAAAGVAPAGPPFLRYRTIDTAGPLVVEAGVPVATDLDPDGEIVTGRRPAGRYVTATHLGHPDGLVAATAALLSWAGERELRWDVSAHGPGERWGWRAESYLTDPTEDMTTWRTRLELRLAE